MKKLAVSILHYLQRFENYATDIAFTNADDNKMKIEKAVPKNTNL